MVVYETSAYANIVLVLQSPVNKRSLLVFSGVQIPFSSFLTGVQLGRPSSALPFRAKWKETMRDRLEGEGV